MSHRALILAACLGISGCLGAENRGDLMILVQRVELLPGVDALDPIDPTPVGRDLRRIRFYFTEPLSQATVDSFDPAVHLSLDGLELDAASPPEFNANAIGLIPARARLTLTLDPGGDGLLSEGTYVIRLKSPEESRLVAELSGTEFKGSFRFVVSVVERDEKLPYLVRFRAGDTVIGEEVPPATLIGIQEEGLVGATTPIPPHARLAAEFSERMRSPLPHAVTPALRNLIALTVENEDGTSLTLGTKAPVYPGIDFHEQLEVVRWTDTVDKEVNRLTTTLVSETPEGLEVDTLYNVRFAGFSGGLSQQAVARDRSGEPLTVRVGRNEGLQGSEAAIEEYAAFRAGPMNDRRFFRTAPIRINAPIPGTTLNRNSFGGMALDLLVSGEAADSVTSMDVSIRNAGAVVVTPVAVPPIVMGGTNRVGVPINLFVANIAFPVSMPDGDYEIVAESFALGTSRGFDTVRLHKDTTPPAVFAGGDFSILGTATMIEDFCVVASGDTVKVEVLLDPAGPPIAESTDRTDIFGGSLSRIDGKFCFADFAVPPGLAYGSNLWYLRLTDASGNVTDPPLPAPRLLSLPLTLAPIPPAGFIDIPHVTIDRFGISHVHGLRVVTAARDASLGELGVDVGVALVYADGTARSGQQVCSSTDFTATMENGALRFSGPLVTREGAAPDLGETNYVDTVAAAVPPLDVDPNISQECDFLSDALSIEIPDKISIFGRKLFKNADLFRELFGSATVDGAIRESAPTPNAADSWLMFVSDDGQLTALEL